LGEAKGPKNQLCCTLSGNLESRKNFGPKKDKISGKKGLTGQPGAADGDFKKHQHKVRVRPKEENKRPGHWGGKPKE